MSNSQKFRSAPAPRSRTRRQRWVKTQGLEEEKYVYKHSGDQVYRAWAGKTPDFALYTKSLGMQPPNFKAEGIMGFSVSKHAHVLYYPSSKGFTMTGNINHRRQFIPRIEKWIFENAYPASDEDPDPDTPSDNSDGEAQEESAHAGSFKAQQVAEQMRFTQIAAQKMLFAEPDTEKGVSSTATSTNNVLSAASSSTGIYGARNTTLFDQNALAELVGFAGKCIAKLAQIQGTYT